MKNKSSGKFLLIALILMIVFFFVMAVISFMLALGGQDSYLTVGVVAGLISFVTSVVALAVYVGYYNKFVKYKNKVDESLSLVDVFLKMRFDLVPNLVEVVKGYTKHEKDVLENITKLRNTFLKQTQEKEKIATSNLLAKEMKKIFLSFEAYPEIKANTVFLVLMEDLKDIEEKIAASRRFYNSNINSYNSLTESFPSNLIAGTFGFKKLSLFKIDANERVIQKVSLN